MSMLSGDEWYDDEITSSWMREEFLLHVAMEGRADGEDEFDAD